MPARQRSEELGTRALVTLALLAVVGTIGSAAPDPVPEPPTFWTGPPSGPVPSTLHGGSVIHAKAVSSLLKRGQAVIIDVSNEEKRPEGLSTEVLWSPPPHAAIPGAHWFPGVGLGAIPPSLDHLFQRKLFELTGNRLDRPLVIYCHQRCWLSWNAARRAIGYGFRRVYWFPDGIEGWRAAGLATQSVSPALK